MLAFTGIFTEYVCGPVILAGFKDAAVTLQLPYKHARMCQYQNWIETMAVA